jgi:adhesin transport system outer membrane protein
MAAVKQWEGEIIRAEAIYVSVIGTSNVPGNLPLLKNVDFLGGKEQLETKVLVRAPSMQKLRQQVKAAEATAESTRAQLFPTLFARVDNTKYFGSGPFDNDTRFSVNFQWQNDVALTQRYRVDAAQYAVEAAKQAVLSEERKLTQTSTAFWADYSAALNRSIELERFALSAEETVRLFKRQFTIGRRSWPEVTNTLQDLYSAQTQKVDAKYAAMNARIKLAFVTGEFDESLNLSIPASKLVATESLK